MIEGSKSSSQTATGDSLAHFTGVRKSRLNSLLYLFFSVIALGSILLSGCSTSTGPDYQLSYNPNEFTDDQILACVKSGKKTPNDFYKQNDSMAVYPVYKTVQTDSGTFSQALCARNRGEAEDFVMHHFHEYNMPAGTDTSNLRFDSEDDNGYYFRCRKANAHPVVYIKVYKKTFINNFTFNINLNLNLSLADTSLILNFIKNLKFNNSTQTQTDTSKTGSDSNQAGNTINLNMNTIKEFLDQIIFYINQSTQDQIILKRYCQDSANVTKYVLYHAFLVLDFNKNKNLVLYMYTEIDVNKDTGEVKIHTYIKRKIQKK